MDPHPVAHAWSPIEAPADPHGLAQPEMRALEKLWRSQRQRLEKHGAWSPFWQRMVRWWSIETGVIERVFDISVGVTQILVEQGFVASLIPHGETDRPAEEVVQILEDHASSIDFMMDVVGGRRPVTTGWIKELHALICAHQDTADAVTQLGQRVKIPLPKGAYKTRSNSPTRSDGAKHEYCPPEHVASEMDRLVEIYQQLPPELPEVRSAWLHHAFTAIHPFEDGNGRVARALASIDFIRGGMFPLLVDRADKHSAYMPGLEAADAGDLKPLVEFFYKREERVALRAISEAETAVERTSGLDQILQAANEKLYQRQITQQPERGAMRSRLDEFIPAIAHRFETNAQQIRDQVPKCQASVDRASPATAHYFRAQVVQLARALGYWPDLREPWEWCRLQLRDGGITDIVVVIHFIGNPSPGACVAVAFITHRTNKEDTSGEDMVTLDAEPLVLYPAEAKDTQLIRLESWVDMTLRASLAIWVKYL